MAKGKYKHWLSEDGLLQLTGWARNGLTDEQIAHNCGISAATLYEWKKSYPEISEALKNSKDIADIAVENTLYNKALSGDITAIIFWLKNRKPNEWRDKRDFEHTQPAKVNVVLERKNGYHPDA